MPRCVRAERCVVEALGAQAASCNASWRRGMKLRPTQIVGLVGIVVFGGILIWTLLKPKYDPYKIQGMPIGEVTAPAPAVPEVSHEAIIPVPPAAQPSNPLAIGSDEAKDDLYCSGIIFATHQASGDVMSAAA